ncbi:MAG: cellulose biosynthesis protein BcsS [Hyphomicrobiaceae bacterium]
MLCVLPAGAWAQDKAAEKASRFESWFGIEGGNDVVTAYGGLVAALYGYVRRDGWRVRSSGGGALYGFNRPVSDWLKHGVGQSSFRGRTTFADVAIGYQKSFGRLTVKAYGGISREERWVRLSGNGAGHGVSRTIEHEEETGALAAIETWCDVVNWGFVQLDGDWRQAFESYSIRSRFGYRVTRHWSSGAEGGLMGNKDQDNGRVGLFARYEGQFGELAAAAGVACSRHESCGAYGSMSMLMRF